MQPTETELTTQERSANLLDSIAEETARLGARYMPTLTPAQFMKREKLLLDLKEMLVVGIDYGVIPGTEKPTLLLPGAQKICSYFSYTPEYTCESIEDWTGAKYGQPLFYYNYSCVLKQDGKRVGEGHGSCNSWESKYRFRWVAEHQLPVDSTLDQFQSRGGRTFEFGFAIDKAETSGKYGKPDSYWKAFKDAIEAGTAVKTTRDTKAGKRDGYEIDTTVYRVPNDAFPDVINTCQKIGQKRAYIAATLSATGASQYFTQDLEDLDIDTGGHPVGTQAAADHVAKTKIQEGNRKAEKSVDVSDDDPPELVEILKQLNAAKGKDRMEVMFSVNDMCASVMDEITLNKLWDEAVIKYGDPEKTARAAPYVLRHMFMAFHNSKKAEAKPL